jgi:hypothetical protein
MGSPLSKNVNDFMRLPSGNSLREAKIRHFEIGPLHSFLGKKLSEPRWVGQVDKDIEG